MTARKKSIIKSFIFILFLFLTTPGKPFTVVPYDSSEIIIKKKPADLLEQLRSNEDLAYPMDQVPRDGMGTGVSSFLRKIIKWFNDLFNISNTNEDVIIDILYFLSSAILLFMLLKIAGSRYSWLFKRTVDDAATLPFDVHQEDIHSIDYEAEIQKAVGSGEYRVAVRLLYLRALKTLSDKEVIYWQDGKTNYDYWHEIKDNDLKVHFEKLSYHFNYVWYGNFKADQLIFDISNEEFLKIKNKA